MFARFTCISWILYFVGRANAYAVRQFVVIPKKTLAIENVAIYEWFLWQQAQSKASLNANFISGERGAGTAALSYAVSACGVTLQTPT